MFTGIELWGLAPLVWGLGGLIAARLLGRRRPPRVTVTGAVRAPFRRAA